MDREIYTPEQIAEMLQVSELTVLRLLRKGELVGTKLGHRTWRIRRADYEAFLESKRVPAKEKK